MCNDWFEFGLKMIMALSFSFNASSYCLKYSDSRLRVRVRSLGDADSVASSWDSIVVNRAKANEKNGVLNDGGIERRKKTEVVIDEKNGRVKSGKRGGRDAVSKDLEVLWDDGYGCKTVKDYLEGCKEMIRPDGGPPRWFCPVDCGQPLEGSPVLLFLPGLDGVGLGLILHHKSLGRVFEVHCLHIPVRDRTPFQGLVKFVEETIKLEHASSPNRPIYLVGDSFGGCLALAVAARNPNIDLVVILANPATSISKTQLQPLLPLTEGLPVELQNVVPYLMCCFVGNHLKMATVDVKYRLPFRLQIEQAFRNLTALITPFSVLTEAITKDVLLWRLELLKSAAAYANSRLHAVKAEVLVLASGQDNMLPSEDEAKRLKSSLKNCTIRIFRNNGHCILLEDGVNLLTIIKGTNKYRRSRRVDFVSDFVPPSMSENRTVFGQVVGMLRFAAGSALFSTLEDGRIVRGLAGVPDEGPVILVGYHNLMGLELYSLVEEFLKEKKIMVRGIAHPELFLGNVERLLPEFSIIDWMKVMGAVPVTASNLYKLLSTKSHVLLYPGGAREALHYKGEEYKLIWPKEPEFVRMAAKFGATVVPFGTVGEDDIAEMLLDYNDLIKIPVVNDYIKENMRLANAIRDESKGEVASRDVSTPVLLPKFPGRFYFLFGRPITTKGREDLLRDRDSANRLYLHVKSEIKRNIDYLLKKREEDPYRNLVDRTVYRALYPSSSNIPAFDV